jgi:fatty acid desaturase
LVWSAFFIFLIAPVVGWVIAEAVRKATGRRRSKPMFLVAAGASALGGIALAIPILFIALLGVAGPEILIDVVWPAIYTALVATTVYSRLSGIQIRR